MFILEKVAHQILVRPAWSGRCETLDCPRKTELLFSSKREISQQGKAHGLS